MSKYGAESIATDCRMFRPSRHVHVLLLAGCTIPWCTYVLTLNNILLLEQSKQYTGVATNAEQCNLLVNSSYPLVPQQSTVKVTSVLSKLCPEATQMPFPVLAMLPLTVNSTTFLFKGQWGTQNGHDLCRQQSILSLPISHFFFCNAPWMRSLTCQTLSKFTWVSQPFQCFNLVSDCSVHRNRI